MKRIIAALFLLLAQAACTAPQIQKPKPSATGIPPANVPNPASVYCVQNGNKHEIHTAANGSQSGVCVFSDGSTCDEWAYYKGECSPSMKSISDQAATVDPTLANANGGSMAPGVSEPFTDWWGVIKSTPTGAQYDDYFERQDLGGSIYFGIDSIDPEIKTQIEILRDSGKIIHLSGVLISNVPDYNGSQVQVERIEIEE